MRLQHQYECYDQTIVNALATTMAGKEPRDWDKHVKQIQSALNTSHNKGINTTPMEALIGVKTKHGVEAQLLNSVREEINRLDLNEIRTNISKHITEDQKRQKERYDKARRDAAKYREGELVMVHVTSPQASGTSRKLNAKYKGPFRITKVLMNDRYEVEDLREGSRRVKTVMSPDHLKRWITMQDDQE